MVDDDKSSLLNFFNFTSSKVSTLDYKQFLCQTITSSCHSVKRSVASIKDWSGTNPIPMSRWGHRSWPNQHPLLSRTLHDLGYDIDMLIPIGKLPNILRRSFSDKLPDRNYRHHKRFHDLLKMILFIRQRDFDAITVASTSMVGFYHAWSCKKARLSKNGWLFVVGRWCETFLLGRIGIAGEN